MIFEQYQNFAYQVFDNKYFPSEKIEQLLRTLNSDFFKIEILGFSTESRPIYALRFGSGKCRILAWSQMHGNEPTTTQASFDFFAYIQTSNEFKDFVNDNFSFLWILQLNPDGATSYTRSNANGVDLNRDFIINSQIETQIFKNVVADFKPDYGFNLHDQRSVFSVGDTKEVAMLSFLAPSLDSERSIKANRQIAVNLIASMVKRLPPVFLKNIGRFDDSYNKQCVGDYLQTLGIPTVLFEAGHSPNDYSRAQTRYLTFLSYKAALEAIYENDIEVNETEFYLNIGENRVFFFDIIYRNIGFYYENSIRITNFAIQFKEELVENSVLFNAYIEDFGDLENRFGHLEIDLHGDSITTNPFEIVKKLTKANFSLKLGKEIVNGLIKY